MDDDEYNSRNFEGNQSTDGSQNRKIILLIYNATFHGLIEFSNVILVYFTK